MVRTTSAPAAQKDKPAFEYCLEARDASFSYDESRMIYSHVSFAIRPGEVFSILGANGSGKSTLLNSISGLFKPKSGSFLFEGQNIHTMDDRERALGIGYVPQMQTIAFDFTVRDYLITGCAPHVAFFAMPGDKEEAWVDQVIQDMRIGHLADKNMKQISGGERQQVQIARALVQHPRLLLLDEPTNHLDYGNQLKILEIIARTAANLNMCVVLTTHMPDHAILLGGKVGLLDRSGHMQLGTTDEIITADRLSEIYQVPLYIEYVEGVGRRACIAKKLDTDAPLASGQTTAEAAAPSVDELGQAAENA